MQRVADFVDRLVRRAQQAALALAQRLADPALISEVASLNPLFAMARATGDASSQFPYWSTSKANPRPCRQVSFGSSTVNEAEAG